MAETPRPAQEPEPNLAEQIQTVVEEHAHDAQTHLDALIQPPTPTPRKSIFKFWQHEKATPPAQETDTPSVTDQQARTIIDKMSERVENPNPDDIESNLVAKANDAIVEDEKLAHEINIQDEVIRVSRIRLRQAAATMLLDDQPDQEVFDRMEDTVTTQRAKFQQASRERARLTKEQTNLRGEQWQDRDFTSEKEQLESAIELELEARIKGQEIINQLVGSSVDLTRLDWTDRKAVAELLAGFEDNAYPRDLRTILSHLQVEMKLQRDGSYDALSQLAELLHDRYPDQFVGASAAILKRKEESMEMSDEQVDAIIGNGSTTLTPELINQMLQKYHITDNNVLQKLYLELGLDPDTHQPLEGQGNPLLGDYAYVLELQARAKDALIRELQAAGDDPFKAGRILAPAFILNTASPVRKLFEGQLDKAYDRAQQETRDILEDQIQDANTTVEQNEIKKRRLEAKNKRAMDRARFWNGQSFQAWFVGKIREHHIRQKAYHEGQVARHKILAEENRIGQETALGHVEVDAAKAGQPTREALAAVKAQLDEERARLNELTLQYDRVVNPWNYTAPYADQSDLTATDESSQSDTVA